MKRKITNQLHIIAGAMGFMLIPSQAHAAAGNTLLTTVQTIWSQIYDIGRPFVWTIAICLALYQYFVQAEKEKFYRPIAAAVVLEIITAMLAWTTTGGGFFAKVV